MSEPKDLEHEEVPQTPVHEESGAHSEPWLVSYADMMTLLFGFFVILYSIEAAKTQDQDGMVRMRNEVSQYFGGNYVNPLLAVNKEVTEKLGTLGILKDVTQHLTPEGLDITFQSTALFAVGQAELTEAAQVAMHSLIETVRVAKGKFSIRVEGYTDDSPISSERYPSNWELSAARASSVVRMFEEAGFDSEHLTAAGFGATHAAFPNRTIAGALIPENQTRNRRVIIKIVSDLLQGPQPTATEGPAEAAFKKQVRESFGEGH